MKFKQVNIKYVLVQKICYKKIILNLLKKEIVKFIFWAEQAITLVTIIFK